MKLLDFEDISARLDAVKIELIPPGKRRELWSRDMSQWVKVKSADRFDNR